jgi:hypothetical protein
MDSTNWLPDKDTTGLFNKQEAADFFRRMKIHYIGFLVYPIVFTQNPNFVLKVGKVPPVMDPIVAGDVLFDTEFKVSVILHKYKD